MTARTVIATTLALLVTVLAASSGAAAQSGPNCFPVYNEYNLGPVTIVQPNSCSAYVVFNGLHPCDDWQPSIC